MAGVADRVAPRLLRRRHAEALPAFRTATLQDDAAVLRAHADQEAVRAATPAVVRLKSALHGVFRFLWAEGAWRPSDDRGELTIVAKPFRTCQRETPCRPSRPGRPRAEGRREGRGGPVAGVLRACSPPRVTQRTHMTAIREAEAPSPFSTTVEKTVENRAIHRRTVRRRLILLVFPQGERVCGPGFSALGAVEHRTGRFSPGYRGRKWRPTNISARLKSVGRRWLQGISGTRF